MLHDVILCVVLFYVTLYYIMPLVAHRWNRNPRPQPHKFSKLVSSILYYFILHFSKLAIWGSSWGRGSISSARGSRASKINEP